MANKNLFRSIAGRLLPKADARNHEGAPAYAFSKEHTLAQYAATGCLNQTFYTSAESQLETVLKLTADVDPEFVAKLAVYCREEGYMKDMPALLCATLTVRGSVYLEPVFRRVIDNGRMLRTFVQILRSGVVGRKSLGSRPKRLVREWLEARTDEAIFRGSVGNDPSLADIVKMVHPKPKTKQREALYGYLLGKEYDADALPELVKQYEEYKRGETRKIPDVPFQFLTSLNLNKTGWTDIARNAPWHMTRMNLNTFARHGVFDVKKMDKLIAARLRDVDAVRRARVFPYQLMVAYMNASNGVPRKVQEALQDAMEIAIDNVPMLDGQVYVFPDVSGSMHSPVTGYRRGASTTVRCIDVAALVAAAILRKNPEAEVMPFEHSVCRVRLNPRDTVMTNAKKLAKVGGGGTDCSAPLRELNRRNARGDLVIYVSDNESWVDAGRYQRSTGTLAEWAKFQRRNPDARMVCIDLLPYGTTQAKDREDILNVGGFSDRVFDLLSAFASGRLTEGHWTDVIGRIEL